MTPTAGLLLVAAAVVDRASKAAKSLVPRQPRPRTFMEVGLGLGDGESTAAKATAVASAERVKTRARVEHRPGTSWGPASLWFTSSKERRIVRCTVRHPRCLGLRSDIRSGPTRWVSISNVTIASTRLGEHIECCFLGHQPLQSKFIQVAVKSSLENISLTSTVGGFTLVGGGSVFPAKHPSLAIHTLTRHTTPLVSIQVRYDATLPPPAEEAAARALESVSLGPSHQGPPSQRQERSTNFKEPPQYRGGPSF